MYPLISILIATYNPNIKWLKEQLESINNQSYESIEVMILDDCSDFDKYEKIQELSKSIIKKFPLKILRNEVNIGSNKTFEKLTFLSNGKYIAYCDQDDVWDSSKIEYLYQEIIRADNVLLSYSDMKIIDENSVIILHSIGKYRKNDKFIKGENIFRNFIYKNCISGCSMLVERDIVLKSIPFPDSMVHDHYISLFVSCFGQISYINKSLTSYRRHSRNQTRILKCVENKQDYDKYHIDVFADRIFFLKNQKELKKHLKFQEEIDIAEQWVKSRKVWWNKFDLGALKKIFKLKSCNIEMFLFELVLARLPNFIFKLAILNIKNKNM